MATKPQVTSAGITSRDDPLRWTDFSDAVVQFHKLRRGPRPPDWDEKIKEFASAIQEHEDKDTIIDRIFYNDGVEIAHVDLGKYYWDTVYIANTVRLKFKAVGDNTSVAKLDTFLERLAVAKDAHRTVLLDAIEAFNRVEGGPGAEQQAQPSEPKWGVPQDDKAINAMLDQLVANGMSEETRQRVEAEIRYAHKVQWDPNPEKLPPELRGLSAIKFLRVVWAEEITRWNNKVYTRTVRGRDALLIDTISAYLSKRRKRDQDRGDAKGLTFIKGFEPLLNFGAPERKKTKLGRRVGTKLTM